MHMQEPGPPLPEDASQWLPEHAHRGKAVSLQYIKDEEAWERVPMGNLTWEPLAPSADQVPYIHQHYL